MPQQTPVSFNNSRTLFFTVFEVPLYCLYQNIQKIRELKNVFCLFLPIDVNFSSVNRVES